MPAIPVYGIVEKRCPHRRTKSQSKAYTGFSGRIARPLRGQFAADCAAKIFPFPLQALRRRGDCTGTTVPTYPQCRRYAAGGVYRGGSPCVPPMQALRPRGDCTGAAAPTLSLAGAPPPGGLYRGGSPFVPPMQALRPRGDCTGAAAPTFPLQALRRPQGDCTGTAVPTYPNAGAPPCTRVTFSPMRKSPKNLPEGAPSGYSPLGGRSRSPCGTAATPSNL